MKIDKKAKENIEFHQDKPYPAQVATRLDENIVFNFPDGIPAFEDSRRFSIVATDNIQPFVYLKSLDVEDLGFICIDPFLVDKNYVVNLPAKDMSILELDDPGDVMVMCTVTVDSNPKNTTANLRAPILINMESRTGRQVILDDIDNGIKFRIWDAIESIRQSEEGE